MRQFLTLNHGVYVAGVKPTEAGLSLLSVRHFGWFKTKTNSS